VFAVRLLRLLVKMPVPVPSVVFVVRATVGAVVVAHTTPRAVTALPLSEVTSPPAVAVVFVIAEANAVVTDGGFNESTVPLKVKSLTLHVPEVALAL
jgi:hypothetical protein